MTEKDQPSGSESSMDPTAPTWELPQAPASDALFASDAAPATGTDAPPPAPPTPIPPAYPEAATPQPYPGPTGPPVPPAYGTAASGGAPAPYGPPPAYGAAPAYGQSPYASSTQPPPDNTSAIILLILSLLGVFSCCGVPLLPAAAFAGVALSKSSTEPDAAARITRNGWIAFGIGVALIIIVGIAYVAYFVAQVANDPYSY